MEFMRGQVIWQGLLGVASLVCFATAISWIRLTYAMYKSGEARPLLLPFPIFMMMDISMMWRRLMSRNRFPTDMEERIEKMRFESIITSNYVKAFILLVFSVVALMLVFRVPR
jgi:NO-binding membrane sensor protein with MHYT domain